MQRYAIHLLQSVAIFYTSIGNQIFMATIPARVDGVGAEFELIVRGWIPWICWGITPRSANLDGGLIQTQALGRLPRSRRINAWMNSSFGSIGETAGHAASCSIVWHSRRCRCRRCLTNGLWVAQTTKSTTNWVDSVNRIGRLLKSQINR